MMPKTFIPKKKIAKEAEGLLNSLQQQVSFTALDSLRHHFKEFLEPHHAYYQCALVYAKKMDYSKQDLQHFCNEIGDYEAQGKFVEAGYYLSALVNKIAEEGGEIVLDFSNIILRLKGVGFSLEKGVLVIKGDTGEYPGENMSGGELIIHGCAGEHTGHLMDGGTIRAEDIASISNFYLAGEIYEAGKRLRPEK